MSWVAPAYGELLLQPPKRDRCPLRSRAQESQRRTKRAQRCFGKQTSWIIVLKHLIAEAAAANTENIFIQTKKCALNLSSLLVDAYMDAYAGAAV